MFLPIFFSKVSAADMLYKRKGQWCFTLVQQYFSYITAFPVYITSTAGNI